ncbi:anaphase-promoting complex subunit [Trifolium repens]|nr:anaphase-promoting complex subunit [Trifolium repens]
MFSGDLVEVVDDLGVIHMAGHNEHGLHCLALNTAIFWNRKNEFHQVALKSRIRLRPPMSYKDACITLNGGNHNEVVSVTAIDCRWLYKNDIALDLC